MVEQNHFPHLPPSHRLSPLPHLWEPTGRGPWRGCPLGVPPTTLASELNHFEHHNPLGLVSALPLDLLPVGLTVGLVPNPLFPHHPGLQGHSCPVDPPWPWPLHGGQFHLTCIPPSLSFCVWKESPGFLQDPCADLPCRAPQVTVCSMHPRPPASPSQLMWHQPFVLVFEPPSPCEVPGEQLDSGEPHPQQCPGLAREESVPTTFCRAGSCCCLLHPTPPSPVGG